MIGVFAKMFSNRERVEEIAPMEGEVGYEIRARAPEDVGRITQGSDAPPENFVEKLPSEGGDVYYVPFLEALRNVLKRKQ